MLIQFDNKFQTQIIGYVYVSFFVIIKDNEYEIMKGSYCSPSDRNSLSSLREAKHKCTEDSSCAMFYDAGGGGTTFHLCPQGSTIETSFQGAILHIKNLGEYLHNLTPLLYFCINILAG